MFTGLSCVFAVRYKEIYCARYIFRAMMAALKASTMNTITPINLVTIKQRLPMLSAAPAAPIKGRGFSRVELTADSECVDFVLRNETAHVAAVSVREAVNRFGKLGTPKNVFCSPEFFALFT
jgi:hypothetical protein